MYTVITCDHNGVHSQSTESPDDWVMITDPGHVIRKCDQLSDYGTQWYGPSDLTAALGKQYKNCGFKHLRCRRKDLPVVPAESPDDWVTQDRVPARPGIDQRAWDWGDGKELLWEDAAQLNFKTPPMHGHRSGSRDTLNLRCRRKDLPVKPAESLALSSPWRPMSERPRCDWFWLAWEDDKVIMSRDIEHWPCPYASAWMPVEQPLHPNSTPPDKQKTRTVMLREYEEIGLAKSYFKGRKK